MLSVHKAAERPSITFQTAGIPQPLFPIVTQQHQRLIHKQPFCLGNLPICSSAALGSRGGCQPGGTVPENKVKEELPGTHTASGSHTSIFKKGRTKINEFSTDLAGQKTRWQESRRRATKEQEVRSRGPGRTRLARGGGGRRAGEDSGGGTNALE